MLYSYDQLQNLNYEEAQKPFSRYLYKFLYQRKEIRKLKFHEKDFLFQNMLIQRDMEGNLLFDLASIDEASDYYLFISIQKYINNLDFNLPTTNHLGQLISDEEMKTDKVVFERLYAKWVARIESQKGKYLGLIHTEVHRRLKRLDKLLSQELFSQEAIDYHKKYTFSIAFYIFYTVCLYFDGIKSKSVIVRCLQNNIVINIYSYIHVLFRHYIPSLDITKSIADRSLNKELPFLDINNLPCALKELLNAYYECKKLPLEPDEEYILCELKGDKYIIWLKYYQLNELNGDFGFELRTLYRCEKERDLRRFNSLSKHRYNSEISFYF